jgi:hypothetical protein
VLVNPGGIPGMAGPVTAVPPMHEEVNDRTEQEKHIGQHAEDVGFVLLPQKERRYGQKEAEAQPQGDAQGLSL